MAKHYTIIELTSDELKNLISVVVREELNQVLEQMRPKENDELLKINDVAKLLAVSQVTIHDWKKRGIIPFYRIAGKIYFKKNEVLESLKRIQTRKC